MGLLILMSAITIVWTTLTYRFANKASNSVIGNIDVPSETRELVHQTSSLAVAAFASSIITVGWIVLYTVGVFNAC